MASYHIPLLFVVLLHLVSVSRACASPQTDLWRAAEGADYVTLVLSLKAGASVNATDESGWSALLFAANSGSIDIVERLLQERADPNLASKDGQTPLMAAVGSGNADVVNALLEAGAQPDATLPSGKTAADLARAKGRMDLVTVLTKAEIRSVNKKEPPPNGKQPRMVSSPEIVDSGVVESSGVDTETIRAFLRDQTKVEQERTETIRQQDQQQDQENRRKEEVAAATERRYRECLTRIASCKQNCRDSGTGDMLGAVAGGLLGGNDGLMAAVGGLLSSSSKSDSCAANCEAAINCEALR